MNELQTFNNPDFGEVRTLNIDGEPWFVAADVCKALELDKTATRRLDEDEKGLRSTQTLGGNQETLVINEPGLYTLVLGSRKPEAKASSAGLRTTLSPASARTAATLRVRKL